MDMLPIPAMLIAWHSAIQFSFLPMNKIEVDVIYVQRKQRMKRLLKNISLILKFQKVKGFIHQIQLNCILSAFL